VVSRMSRCAVVLSLAAAVSVMACVAPVQAADYPPPDANTQRVIESLPVYQPQEKVDGTIRLWGHGSFKRDFMGKLFKEWIRLFQRRQPDVSFEYLMYGTASAVGALYTDAGDIALLGEEISPAAARAFLRARGYAHTDIAVATGSVDVNFYDYAHMIFVHKDNPIERLSLSQLDAIFGAENRRAGKSIRTWGELGLDGAWAKRPIQPHGWKTDVDFALFFRERVLENSQRWNPAIREYVHIQRSDGTQYDHGQQIVDAVAREVNGIGISNTRYATEDVKVLALSWNDNGPWYSPTAETLISQNYPLVRIIPAIIDREPGKPVKPAVREFLQFVLSREGQQTLVKESGYLPLDRSVIEAQRRKLE
jgi:phosphate transport system substrate-binding protein